MQNLRLCSSIPDSSCTERNRYRIKSLFTHKNGDFGAISVMERIWAVPISKLREESHIGMDRYVN